MAEEKLLTIREVALMLGLTEKQVMDLAENSTIPAYKVGGVYLRFKRQQVEEFKKEHLQEFEPPRQYSFKDRIFDFCYFNDFYIFSFFAILAVLYIIFR